MLEKVRISINETLDERASCQLRTLNESLDYLQSIQNILLLTVATPLGTMSFLSIKTFKLYVIGSVSCYLHSYSW